MALHQAARAGDLATARQLLAEGRVDVDARDKLNRTPLHLAAWAGQSDIVQLLCENKAAVGATATDDMSALHFACQKGHLEVVRLLLAGGAKVNNCSKKGFSPLHYAVQGQNLAVIKLIARKGPQQLTLLNKKGESAMDLAKNDEVRSLLKELETELAGKADKKGGKGKKLERDSHQDTRGVNTTEACRSDVGSRSEVLSKEHGENDGVAEETGKRNRSENNGNASMDDVVAVGEAGLDLEASDSLRRGSPTLFGERRDHRLDDDDIKTGEVIGPMTRPVKETGHRKRTKVELGHLGLGDDDETEV